MSPQRLQNSHNKTVKHFSWNLKKQNVIMLRSINYDWSPLKTVTSAYNIRLGEIGEKWYSLDFRYHVMVPLSFPLSLACLKYGEFATNRREVSRKIFANWKQVSNSSLENNKYFRYSSLGEECAYLNCPPRKNFSNISGSNHHFLLRWIKVLQTTFPSDTQMRGDWSCCSHRNCF